MRVEHVQLINAPVECVWQHTVDFAQLPVWLPTVTEVEIVDKHPLQCGARVRIRQPGMGFATWTVESVRPKSQFVWHRRFLGMQMVARHDLRTTGAGTLNRLEIELKGGLSAFLGPLLRGAILKTLARENEAFRKSCEAANEAC